MTARQIFGSPRASDPPDEPADPQSTSTAPLGAHHGNLPEHPAQRWFGRLATTLHIGLCHIGALRDRMPRPIRWLLAHPRRVLVLAWLIGLGVVGGVDLARADDLMPGPDLTGGGPKTLYETYSFLDYKLTVKPDDESSGWFDLGTVVLQVVGFVNNLILWAALGPLRGGLVLLEWFLNLTIYRDSSYAIDEAVHQVATQVFWPLIAATTAVGAFITYARWRNDGRGFMGDMAWVVAAVALAMSFAAGPSAVMRSVDSVRQDLANNIITANMNYRDNDAKFNPTGFPTPVLTGGDAQKTATRRLVDGLWGSFGTPLWCMAEFRSLDVCKVAGHHALANDDTWRKWMKTLDDEGVVPEFREYTNWIRGQDITRTGVVLLAALMALPMAVLLLRLVIAGLVAAAGLLLMLVIGLLLLTFWPIPGWFRQTGVRYLAYVGGLELQALFITAVISGVAVVSTILALQVGRYGFLLIAVLNIVLLVAATKVRAWLDTMTTVSGAGSMGYMGAMLASGAARLAGRAVGAVVSRSVQTAVRATRGTGTFAARHAARAINHLVSEGSSGRPRIAEIASDAWKAVRQPFAGMGPTTWEPVTRPFVEIGSKSWQALRTPFEGLSPTNRSNARNPVSRSKTGATSATGTAGKSATGTRGRSGRQSHLGVPGGGPLPWYRRLAPLDSFLPRGTSSRTRPPGGPSRHQPPPRKKSP